MAGNRANLDPVQVHVGPDHYAELQRFRSVAIRPVETLDASPVSETYGVVYCRKPQTRCAVWYLSPKLRLLLSQLGFDDATVSSMLDDIVDFVQTTQGPPIVYTRFSELLEAVYRWKLGQLREEYTRMVQMKLALEAEMALLFARLGLSQPIS